MRPPSSRHLALLAMCAGCAVVASCFSMSSQATDAALGYFAVDLEDTATTSANASIGDLDDGHGQFTVNATFGKAQWSTRNIRLADITPSDMNGDGQKDIVAARSGARNQLYLGYRTEQD